MAIPTPRSPAFNRVMAVIEWAGILLFAGSVLFAAARLTGQAVALGPLAVAALLLIPVGVVAADVFTGAGHYLADNFGRVDTPVLGHMFIYRFRQHHDDQTLICLGDFREINGGLCLLMLPAAATVAALSGGAPSAVGLAVGTLVLSFAVGGAATNQVHRWAHDRACPAPVRVLQRAGILLSPRRHAIHHRAPHHLHFCITIGVLNPLLDRIGFWHRLADGLVALGVPQAEESVMGHRRASALAIATTPRRASAGAPAPGDGPSVTPA